MHRGPDRCVSIDAMTTLKRTLAIATAAVFASLALAAPAQAGTCILPPPPAPAVPC